MELLGPFLSVLEAGIGLWKHKSQRKYLDQVIKLKEKYYAEDAKERPDMAVLGECERKLLIISETFATEVSRQAAKDL